MYSDGSSHDTGCGSDLAPTKLPPGVSEPRAKSALVSDTISNFSQSFSEHPRHDPASAADDSSATVFGAIQEDLRQISRVPHHITTTDAVESSPLQGCFTIHTGQLLGRWRGARAECTNTTLEGTSLVGIGAIRFRCRRPSPPATLTTLLQQIKAAQVQLLTTQCVCQIST